MNLLRPAKKGQLTNYCLFIASRWFESADDYSNVEKGCKRFYGNTSKFFYNPIPLTEQTREWFDHLQTLFIYSSKDMRFEEDERIKRREYVYLRGIMNEKEITQGGGGLQEERWFSRCVTAEFAGVVGVALAEAGQGAGLYMQCAGDSEAFWVYRHSIWRSFGNPCFDFLP